MDKLDFSEYGQDLFINSFDDIETRELNQSQNNCASSGGGTSGSSGEKERQ
jgi:hypothetical protein